MAFDKAERLRVLLYEYYFSKSSLYESNLSTLVSRLNYKKIDNDLVYRIHNAKVELDTFEKVMSDVLDLLSFYG